MLFKLSYANIKKSFKDYAIYFFTLILGVAIFYIFNAIEDQSVFLKVSSSTREIIKLMNNMLSGVSVFVSFILGFLIIYASRFLMKRRKKEFGIYMTLGMGKGKISKVLFFETLMIGILSLGIGLVFGILLSQFMSIFVANMFEADLTKFSFTISQSATLKTIVYFTIMYLLVMIFNTFSVGKCKLIDLLYANKKSEQVKMKNPYLCVFVFICASIMLGYAYYLVTGGVTSLNSPDKIFIPIILGTLSTFLIIWSLSGLLLKIVMSMKNVYYKGLNSFTLRQISSKINTTVISMTMVCLMLFITICVLSSSLSIKNSMTANLKELAPADIQFYKTLDIDERIMEDYGYSIEQVKNSSQLIKDDLKQVGFDVDAKLKDIVDMNTYATNDILIEDTLGTYYEEAKKTYPQLAYDSAESFVRISDYNKLATLYGKPTYTLEEDEYIIIADFDSWITIRNEGLKRNTPITLLGKTYYPKYQECQDGFLDMTSSHVNIGTFLVPDDAVDDSMRERNILAANYKANTEEEKQAIEKEIASLDTDGIYLSASSKLAIYEGSVGLGAMVTFIGLYLGIIFMMTSAALLALKELSESSDNKERFAMLRKIGTDEKMINKALFYQIAIFFFFPLALAILHSVFGIIFCSYLLETFGGEQLLKSILMTAGVLIFIYGGYFILTYLCSKNIIKEK